MILKRNMVENSSNPKDVSMKSFLFNFQNYIPDTYLHILLFSGGWFVLDSDFVSSKKNVENYKSFIITLLQIVLFRLTVCYKLEHIRVVVLNTIQLNCAIIFVVCVANVYLLSVLHSVLPSKSLIGIFSWEGFCL